MNDPVIEADERYDRLLAWGNAQKARADTALVALGDMEWLLKKAEEETAEAFSDLRRKLSDRYDWAREPR